MKTTRALVAMVMAASFLLGACNTIEGMGQDTKAAGQKVEKEAQEHKKY